MISMLETVVQEGTGRDAAIDGYRVAGKTGTAEYVDEDTGLYAKTPTTSISACCPTSTVGMFLSVCERGSGTEEIPPKCLEDNDRGNKPLPRSAERLSRCRA